MLGIIKDLLIGTRVRAVLTGTATFAVISVLDFYTRNEISLEVFYVIPIFVFTWRVSRRWGAAAAVGGMLDWLIDEKLFSASSSYPVNILVWNAVVRLAFFLTVVYLINEIKTILARERAVSKLKSSMIHVVSHEFNNSLTGLSTGLFLLREMEPEGMAEARRTLYTAMQTSQQRLSLYVKNILNEARMEDGRFKVEKRPVALRDLATGAVEALRSTLSQKGLRLSMEMPEKAVQVSADREAMALVISNLLGNAVKYTRQGGEITVRIEASGTAHGNVLFSVEDSGIGISLEDLKKITAGFYRTGEGQMQAEGFGLGLKISNELLELHGSKLEISSEKGKGSCFYFELPQIRPGA